MYAIGQSAATNQNPFINQSDLFAPCKWHAGLHSFSLRIISARLPKICLLGQISFAVGIEGSWNVLQTHTSKPNTVPVSFNNCNGQFPTNKPYEILHSAGVTVLFIALVSTAIDILQV